MGAGCDSKNIPLPGFVLHRAQLQFMSQEYPHAGAGSIVPCLARHTMFDGFGLGGVGLGFPPHHLALPPPLQRVKH